MERFVEPLPDKERSRSFISVRRLARADAPVVALGAFTLIACAVFASFLLVTSYRRAYFFGDDFIALWVARSMPLGRFILEPLNEHMVPLHRVIAYFSDAIWPMNFGFALLVLFAFYALGAIYLYRILHFVEGGLEETSDARFGSSERLFERGVLLRTKASWFLLAAYCSNVYLGSLYQWWTAGLHRLPYIAFSIMAIYYYLRYRADRRRRWVAACAICSIAALGFFTKGVLIPVYLLALEVCLLSSTPRAQVWKNLRLVAVFGVAAVGFLALWHKVEPAESQAINTRVRFQLEFLKVSWLMLRDSSIGAIYADNSDPVALGFVLWIVGLTYTLSRRPSTLWIWGALALVVALNVLLTSASKHRTGAFGVTIALLSFRYYYEMLFLVVVFAALAFQRVRALPASASPGLPGLEREFGEERTQIRHLSSTRSSGEQLDTPGAKARVRWWPALGCMALVTGLMWNSHASWTTKMLKDDNGVRARNFVLRLQHDRQRIQKTEPGPLRFVDAMAPHYIGCPLGILLAALKIDATPVPHGPGAYMVLASGQIVPAS